MSSTYFKLKSNSAVGDTGLLAELCAHVVDALGCNTTFNVLGEPEPATITLARGDDLLDVPCIAAVTDGNDHPILLAVQAETFTTDPSLLITSDTKPTRRPHRHGHPDQPIDGTDAVPGLVNAVYATDHLPRWILVVAGGAGGPGGPRSATSGGKPASIRPAISEPVPRDNLREGARPARRRRHPPSIA